MAKEYRPKKMISANIDLENLKKFDDVCWMEHKDRTEKLQELIYEAIQKNQVGLTNPIKVPYNENKKVPTWRQLLLTDLQDFTVNECKEKIFSIEDQNQLTKLNFLGRTIT